MGYLGIDASKDFTVNGMKYGRNGNGWYESQADSEAKSAYEMLKAAWQKTLEEKQACLQKLTAKRNCAKDSSDRLIFFVYQWRHSIIFLESFAVIACTAKTIFIGYVSDTVICAKQCGKAFS